jgi:Cyclic nucleotide-binding domain/Pyridoxamine 5'-phosphate oxidase
MTLMSSTQAIPMDVVDYLGRHHVITVSTPSFTGMPHADTVVYVNDLSTIYFHVVDESILARNIRDSKFVSFTIDDYTPQWSKLRELQGVGRGAIGEPHDAAAVQALFSTKFGPTFVRPPGRLHALTPIEMHFVDYEQRQREASSEQPTANVVYQSAPTDDRNEPRRPEAHPLDRLLFEPGEMILRPSDIPGRLYIVVEGSVELRTEGFGADQTVVRIGPGQTFSDDGAVVGRAGRLVAQARERSVLLRVGGPAG